MTEAGVQGSKQAGTQTERPKERSGSRKAEQGHMAYEGFTRSVLRPSDSISDEMERSLAKRPPSRAVFRDESSCIPSSTGFAAVGVWVVGWLVGWMDGWIDGCLASSSLPYFSTCWGDRPTDRPTAFSLPLLSEPEKEKAPNLKSKQTPVLRIKGKRARTRTRERERERERGEFTR